MTSHDVSQIMLNTSRKIQIPERFPIHFFHNPKIFFCLVSKNNIFHDHFLPFESTCHREMDAVNHLKSNSLRDILQASKNWYIYVPL